METKTRGATSVMFTLFLLDSTSTKGAGLATLTSASTNLQIGMRRELSSAVTLYTGSNIQAQTTIGTFLAPSDNAHIRFKPVDTTNMPGVYEIQVSDTAVNGFGTGDTSSFVDVFVTEITTTALNIAPAAKKILLEAINRQDGVHFGLTALPNTACTTNASLLTSGTGTDQVSNASGVVKSNPVQILGTAISTPATVGILDVNVKNIVNAAAALDANNLLKVDAEDWKGGVIPAVNVTGVPKVDVVDLLGTAWLAPGTAGTPDINVKLINGQTATAAAGVTFPSSIASPTNITAGTITTVTNLTNAATAGDLTATMKTSVTTAATAATPIAASVTGAVGSVTATVAANVTQLLGTAWLTPGTAGTPDVNAKQLGGTAQTGRDVGASVLLSSGTGTGQINLSAGKVAEVVLTDTVTTYTGNTPQTGDAYARLGAPAGASMSADVAAVKSDTAAAKSSTAGLTFTVANQVDSNVLDWKSSTAPAMTGDAYARLGAPAGASVSADVAAVKTDLDAGVLISSAGADAVLDRSNGVETGFTLRQSLRLMLSALAGKLSGAATTTVSIRDVGDSKNRIVATVDANGNRTAVTYIDT